MSKGRKTDYAILAGLAVFATLFILGLIVSGWGEQRAPRGPAIRTTHSAADKGALAVYLLFQRLDMPMVRCERPLFADALADVDVLFVIDPLLRPNKGEVRAVRRWVEGGGVLVCTLEAAEALRLVADDDEAIRVIYLLSSSQRLAEGGDADVPEDRAGLPLAREVRAVRLDSARGDYYFETGDAPDPFAPLFADAEGVRIAARKVVAGRMIVLANSSFLANGWIGKADNAVLAANLVAYCRRQARGRRVAWDEYHLGYGAGPTGWTAMASMLVTTPAGWAVLAATAGGLLLVFYKARRFGTRRAPRRVRRRSKLEYVHSVGATWRAAGANALVLRVVFRWFRGRCAAVAALPESASSREIAQRLARRTARPPGRYQHALDQCERAATRGRLSARRLAGMLAGLAQLESEIF